MAKKVVATLKSEGGKSYSKVIKSERSPKTGAYMFKEQIIPSTEVKEMLAKK